MRIELANNKSGFDHVYLSSIFRQSDVPIIMKHMECEEIARNNFNVPFPYTKPVAQGWLKEFEAYNYRFGTYATNIIRDVERNPIGEIGIDFNKTKTTGELSYWLAKEYWGMGIMTIIVNKMCVLGFGEFGLNKMVAYVNPDNAGSIKVLEKNGFKQEGYLEEHYWVEKSDTYNDVRLFGLIKKNFVGKING